MKNPLLKLTLEIISILIIIIIYRLVIFVAFVSTLGLEEYKSIIGDYNPLYYIIDFAICYYYVKKDKMIIPFDKTFNKQTLFSILGIALLGRVIDDPITNIIPYWDAISWDQLRISIATIETNEPHLILKILCVVLLGSIGEELIFRGIIQTKLSRYCKPYVAITITSILFSIYHTQIYLIPLYVYWGWIFGYAYFKTKSITYPIILHSFSNFIILFIDGKTVDISSFQAKIFIGIYLISLTVGVALMINLNNLKNEKGTTSI